jgi:hypothetical protein
VQQRESFVFETVPSDPVGDKLAFLKEAARAGYTVVLRFIGISGPDVSEERVAMSVSPGRPQLARGETGGPIPAHAGQCRRGDPRAAARLDLRQ